MAKAKLQLQTEADYFHLLSALACDSSKLLRVNFQQDFVLDSDCHTLWDAGLTLTIRSTRDEASKDASSKSITIVLKETKVDVSRPYFEVIEREEECPDPKEVDNILRSGVPATQALGTLTTELLQKFPDVKIKCIGSFQNVRHVFLWEDGITLEVDRCTFFPTGFEAFFCRFDSNDEVIHRCLTFMTSLQVSYCVHMASKSSLFFSYLKQTPQSISTSLPTIESLRGTSNNNSPPLPSSSFSVVSNINQSPFWNSIGAAQQAVTASASNGDHTIKTTQPSLPLPLPTSNITYTNSITTMPRVPTSIPSHVALPSATLTPPSSSTLAALTTPPPTNTTSTQPSTLLRPSSSASISPHASPSSANLDVPRSHPSTSQHSNLDRFNPSTSPDADTDPSSIAQVQRKRNREASARYRKRKVEEAMGQQETIQGLRKQIEDLETENRLLKAQVRLLKGSFRLGPNGVLEGGGVSVAVGNNGLVGTLPRTSQ